MSKMVFKPMCLYNIIVYPLWRVQSSSIRLFFFFCSSESNEFANRGGFYNGVTWVLDYNGPNNLMIDERDVLMHPFLYDIL